MAQRLQLLVDRLMLADKRKQYQDYLDREVFGHSSPQAWEPVKDGAQTYWRNAKTGEIKEEKP